METFQLIWHYITNAGLNDFLDIALVAFVLYKGMRLIKDTNAIRLIKGIFLLILAMQLSGWFNFYTINFILKNTMTVGLTALVIVFQPELRKMLEQVGKSRFTSFLDKEKKLTDSENSIEKIVAACVDMSKTKTGALMIFERQDVLADVKNTGTILDACITEELVKNIFYPKSPLHDGAAIIIDNRIYSAACVLNLSANQKLSKDLGTRHRAAVGTTETSDAIAVVVSEETGSISVSIGGMLKRHLTPDTLNKILTSELGINNKEEEKKTKFWNKKEATK